MAGRRVNVNVGVLGHINSGKTALARALSTTTSTAAFDKQPRAQHHARPGLLVLLCAAARAPAAGAAGGRARARARGRAAAAGHAGRLPRARLPHPDHHRWC
ncbi:selenocysteine-specific elongation factor-like isoform X2 [Delphinapterus leucas]|uniref:Selenocysteine-specific elongation factor-like isoform X2 n=1 Tax=Delphinapterus leucas TaxID=9749 RepID=A0A2Y9MTS6_DELLE|nr:selenocysteine-specific elongation factor-like isoform X2 [Delphinapterus leucas]